MIGQQNLLKTLDSMIMNHNFPRFALFVGATGSGKKTLIHELFPGESSEDSCIYAVNTVESVRATVNLAYIFHNKIFVFTDIDDMSIAAKNALLKIVEECPNDNMFIMTAENENNVLDTIKSRAIVFHMEEYTSEELVEYCKLKYPYSDVSDYILSVCDNPGEIDALMSAGGSLVYDYVNKVIDNIALVSGANAFKIGEKIAFKDEEDKIDLKLFLKTFSACCIDRFKGASNFDIVEYSRGCQITSKYIRDLRIKGINKQMLFDSWLLDIREAWR